MGIFMSFKCKTPPLVGRRLPWVVGKFDVLLAVTYAYVLFEQRSASYRCKQHIIFQVQ
jgi:hypothetical protein